MSRDSLKKAKQYLAGRKRLKHKFAMGQVVVIEKGWQGQDQYARVDGVRPDKDAPVYFLYPLGIEASEVSLRLLTKREIGADHE